MGRNLHWKFSAENPRARSVWLAFSMLASAVACTSEGDANQHHDSSSGGSGAGAAASGPPQS
ncbi:MAG TPA: hypothetical protein VJV78_27335, partial [Polyangiales bacterium]|nr:hypothetical protein [Polyangiales bacterium]